jgi:hypothetical protein
VNPSCDEEHAMSYNAGIQTVIDLLREQRITLRRREDGHFTATTCDQQLFTVTSSDLAIACLCVATDSDLLLSGVAEEREIDA